MDTKIIALFNHKGGVSKTTTTYHIGWKLSTMGKKVLLVDGDPQCNLTSLLLREQFDEYYEKGWIDKVITTNLNYQNFRSKCSRYMR